MTEKTSRVICVGEVMVELSRGNETRYGYLPVSSATNLTIRGTIGGSGTNSYTVLVNKVVPAGGNPLVLTGGR